MGHEQAEGDLWGAYMRPRRQVLKVSRQGPRSVALHFRIGLHVCRDFGIDFDQKWEIPQVMRSVVTHAMSPDNTNSVRAGLLSWVISGGRLSDGFHVDFMGNSEARTPYYGATRIPL